MTATLEQNNPCRDACGQGTSTSPSRWRTPVTPQQRRQHSWTMRRSELNATRMSSGTGSNNSSTTVSVSSDDDGSAPRAVDVWVEGDEQGFGEDPHAAGFSGGPGRPRLSSMSWLASHIRNCGASVLAATQTQRALSRPNLGGI